MRKLNFTSLSLSCGWLIPIEKYSSVLAQGLRGTSSVVRGNPFKHHSETQCFSSRRCGFAGERPTRHNSTVFLCSKTKQRNLNKRVNVYLELAFGGEVKALQAAFRSSCMAACCSGLSCATHSAHSPPEV